MQLILTQRNFVTCLWGVHYVLQWYMYNPPKVYGSSTMQFRKYQSNPERNILFVKVVSMILKWCVRLTLKSPPIILDTLCGRYKSEYDELKPCGKN